jgi:hypothetical protein
MSKPNWACSVCGMYSSRRWSVERHILNLHDGLSNVVPFVDYLVGRNSGFYLPKFRPTFVKKNASKTVTLMDTFKNEFLKTFASNAVNKALSPHQYKTINLICKDLVVMGPLTTILVNHILSLRTQSQGLKTSSDLRYTLAKNAHL